MVILSKQERIELGDGSNARHLFQLLRGGDSHVRLETRGNTPSNESGNLRAAPAVPLTTLFQPLTIVRAIGTETSGASASRVVQSTGGVVITEASDESPDPTTFDPTHRTAYEVIKKFRKLGLPRAGVSMDDHFKARRDLILRYSVSLQGFPYCPERDLMLAVYFFLEETFGIRAENFKCCFYDYHYRRPAERRVGILFERYQTAEYVINRAYLAQGSGIRILPNNDYGWIMAEVPRN